MTFGMEKLKYSKTRVMPCSFELSALDVADNNIGWKRRPDRRKFNNMSLARKNSLRRVKRDSNAAIKESVRQITEAEDKLFMDLLSKQL